MKIFEWLTRILSKLFGGKSDNNSQKYVDKSKNEIIDSPGATINRNVQIGAKITTSKEPPTAPKDGDIWYQILDGKEKK